MHARADTVTAPGRFSVVAMTHPQLGDGQVATLPIPRQPCLTSDE
jgi:hypothetical protein